MRSVSSHASWGRGVEEKWCGGPNADNGIGTYIKKEEILSIAGSFDSNDAVKQTRSPDYGINYRGGGRWKERIEEKTIVWGYLSSGVEMEDEGE